jgi:hypothetical protein
MSGMVLRGRGRTLIAAAATVLAATSCLDDANVAPDGSRRADVRLSIAAVVSDAQGEIVEISVFYSRTTGERVMLPSSPAQVAFGGTRIDVPVTVNLGPCLDDAQRVPSTNTGSCAFNVKLRLLNAERAPLDSNTTPATASGAGEVVRLAPPPLASGPRYTVDVRAAASNAGPGRLSGNGIDCTISGTSTSGTCSVQLAQGTNVNLVAQGLDNNGLSAWGGRCSGTGACSFAVNANATVTAGFTAPTASLTVQALSNNAGPGKVTGNGIDCSITGTTTSGTCTVRLNRGTPVTLAGQGANGNALNAWSDPCTGNGPCSFALNADAVVSVGFTAAPLTLTVQAGPGNAGPGHVIGNGIDCTISTSGTTTDRCSVQLPPNTPVSLTAVATAGNRMSAWSGPCTGAAVCTFTITEAKTVFAAFTAPTTPPVTITVAAGSGNSGIGQVTGNNLSCVISGSSAGGSCSVQVPAGTPVSLNANPQPGYSFVGWAGGGCTGVGACRFDATVDVTVSASFLQQVPASITLTPPSVTFSGTEGGTNPSSQSVAITNGGTGTLSGLAIGAIQYGSGAADWLTTTLSSTTAPATVTLTATIGTLAAGTYTVIIPLISSAASNSPQKITVTLIVNPSSAFTMTINGAGTGNGSVVDLINFFSGINCTIIAGTTSGRCKVSYPSGTTVTLNAKAADGHTFGGWSACAGTGYCQVTMTQDRIVSATFTALAKYTITAVVNPASSGTVTGAGSYSEGTLVSLAATAADGYRFVNWHDFQGTVVSTSATYQFTASSDRYLIADFTRVP